MADENHINNDQSDDSTYECSICNIDVPKLYWKLHNDSYKHKTCLDIAVVAMQRVRENLIADAPTTCPDTLSTYYCECCATAVNIQQRTEHEASKTHIDSLKLDESLFNLLQLYKDMKYVNALDNNSSNVDIKRAKKRVRIRKNKGSNEIIANEELRVLNNYVEDINDNLEPDSYIYIINNEHLHITVDYCLFRVHVRNFNGITMFKDYNQWKCLLCNHWLNTTDIMTHCANENHINSIKMKILNKGCVRIFEVPGEMRSRYVHCILCNIRMHHDLLSYHVDSDIHKKAFDQSLIYEQNDSNKIYCRVCNINVYVYNFSSHEKGYNHLRKLKSIATDCQGVESSTNKNNIEKRVNHYLMKATTNPTEYVCEICNVTIPGNDDYISDHVNGKRHLYKYNMMLSNNRIVITERGYYCEICHVNIYYKNEITHIYGRNHQSNIANI